MIVREVLSYQNHLLSEPKQFCFRQPPAAFEAIVLRLFRLCLLQSLLQYIFAKKIHLLADFATQAVVRFYMPHSKIILLHSYKPPSLTRLKYLA
jgi:hypothetical protein